MQKFTYTKKKDTRSGFGPGLLLKAYYLLLFFAFIFITSGCENNGNSATGSEQRSAINTADSLQIVNLITDLYEWHYPTENSSEDIFPLLIKEDSSIAGIDSIAFEENILKINELGFFTNSFLKKIRELSGQIDKAYKKNTKHYISGEIPPYGPYESDILCNCQDYPDNPQDHILIKNLTITNNTATAIWGFEGFQDHNYKISFLKEESIWKINHLSGFDFKLD